MKNYDYLVVGSGLFGAVFSYYALKSGKSVLVLEKRPHIGGNVYTELIEDIDVHRYGADVKTNIDYFDFIKNPFATSKKTVFTGAIDEFFGFKYGHLQYRTVRFDTKILDTPNFQGVAVMNFTDRETPYTRCIEHKHFEYGTQPKTVVSYEYSQEWQEGSEPYYPVNDEKNNALYEKYSSLAASEKNVIFGGRLGQYKYYDMDKVILSAFSYAEKEGLK